MFSSTPGGKIRSRSWRALFGGMALVGLLFCLPLTSAGAATKKHESKSHSASHKGGAAKKSHAGKSHATHKTGHHNKSKKHKGIHARARRHGSRRHHALVAAAKRHRFAYWCHHHWFGTSGVAVAGTPDSYIYTGGWRRAYWGLHAWRPRHWRRITTLTSTGQTTPNTASSTQTHHTSHQQGSGKTSGGHGSSGHAAHK